ncbi:Type 3 secretion system secretin [subsurface metagenome]
MYKRIILFLILFLLFTVPSAFGKANLANITVKNVDNYTDVIFNLSEGISYTDFRMDNKVVVDFLDVDSDLGGKGWTIDRGGIKNLSVSIIPSAELTRVIIQCDNEYNYTLKSTGNGIITLSLNTNTTPFSSWTATTVPKEEVKEVEEEPEPTVPTYPKKVIDAILERADLVTALRSIAKYSGMNMIIGDDVKGTISVELKNVHWEKALDLILKTKGYTYIIEIDIIRVGTAESFAQEREKGEMAKPLMRRVFTLEYTTPKELSSIVKSSLSKRGVVEQDTRTNSLIVTDIPSKIASIEELVIILDKETPQVAIISKIIDIDRSAALELGISWDVNNLRVSDWNVEGDASFVTPAEPLSGIYLNVATVRNFARISARLSAMEQEQKLTTLANPRITTVNNKEATIFGGKRFAITTTDIHGQPVTRWFQAGIELSVTPHINSLEDITMDISVELSDVVAEAETPTITQTKASTQSLVKNGQTLVIGGFINKTVTSTKTGIPILKDIPIIGNLFGKTVTRERNREVLIFITPHIVKD